MTRLITLGKTVIIISVAFVSHLAYNYLNTRKKQAVQKEIHEVLLFSEDRNALGKSKYSKCLITQSMDRLLYYVNSPTYTLDICMHALTNLDLAQSVMRQHFRGVKVRVIIDGEMILATGSQVKRLQKQQIPVRWMKSTYVMNHKFTLIDASSDNPEAVPLLITGSFNWTNQAISGNWNSAIVTTQKDIVEQYKLQFEKLWAKFNPIPTDDLI